MRILLDTNVLIDLYTQRPPDHGIAQRLLVMQEFGDAELWASAKSFTDVFYVLSKHYESERIQAAFEQSFQWLQVCAVDLNDLKLACKRKWPDFEDCLVDICAEKVKADLLLTRDAKGFEQSKTSCVSPSAFFECLENDFGLAYDFADL